eukprot:SAG31_NODE_3713_length_3957_cov_3.801452_1_plen_395_part_00
MQFSPIIVAVAPCSRQAAQQQGPGWRAHLRYLSGLADGQDRVMNSSSLHSIMARLLQLTLVWLLVLHPAAVLTADALVVGCVGDSITQGVGASCARCNISNSDCPGCQACGASGCARAWPGQLQALLGPGHAVLNWGHVAATMQRTVNCDKRTVNCGGRYCDVNKTSGAPVPCRSNGPPYWVTREFARATNKTAPLDVVVIMLGTNDAKRNNWLHLGNASQFASDALAMAKTFSSLPQRPAIFLSTPPPLYHPTYTMNQTVAGTVMPAILEKACAATARCTSIDMVGPLGGWPALADPQYFLPNATNGGCDVPRGKPDGCKGDGCHPDDAGHHAIAVVVQKAIRLLLLQTSVGDGGVAALRLDDDDEGGSGVGAVAISPPGVPTELHPTGDRMV